MTLVLVVIGMALTAAFLIALFAWLPRMMRNGARRRRK